MFTLKRKFKIITIILTIVIVTAVIIVSGGVIYLYTNQYTPEEKALEVFGVSSMSVSAGDKLKLTTYNIGYGIKDSNSDYFEDGGKSSKAQNYETVDSNIQEIAKTIEAQKSNIIFIQDADIASDRSHCLDEVSFLSTHFNRYSNAYADDQICTFAFYPTSSPLGKIRSGSVILTKYKAKAELKTLPNDSKFPDSAWNRKSVLLVDRIPVEDSKKEVVLININLDSYNSDIRLDQYKALCEFMQIEYAKGNYVITGGCFNSELPSVNKNKYPIEENEIFMPSEISTEFLTGGWKYCTDDSYPTMRVANSSLNDDSIKYVVDGFITSPNTIVSDTKTVNTSFANSNHNPVTVEVTLVK